jgi:hypothetical protein
VPVSMFGSLKSVLRPLSTNIYVSLRYFASCYHSALSSSSTIKTASVIYYRGKQEQPIASIWMALEHLHEHMPQ